ncbi:hypothetical protein [Microbacter margulisiae]|uniref:Lipoprotein n=1 Tax=Microbacter margulisiae TaxID=1350067 RepID=A0A7W5DPS0_9PORP|nr:hypothetical protein [Microbacter margulisiae]MBB3186835.1 hypothetical protein [Microbacter margulisiae]
MVFCYKKVGILVGVIALLYGCSTTFIPINTSYTDYKYSKLSRDTFAQSSVAVFPFFSDSLYRNDINGAENDVYVSLAHQFPKLHIISSEQIRQRIKLLTHKNKDEQTLLSNYSIFSSSTRQFFYDLYLTDHCRYVLYSVVRRKKESQIINQHGKPLKHFEPIEVEIFTQMWDNKNGTIVWQGAGSSSTIKDIHHEPIDTLSLIHLASNNLIQRICDNDIGEQLNTQSLYNLQQKRMQDTSFNLKMIIGGLTLVSALVVYFIVSP